MLPRHEQTQHHFSHKQMLQIYRRLAKLLRH